MGRVSQISAVTLCLMGVVTGVFLLPNPFSAEAARNVGCGGAVWQTWAPSQNSVFRAEASSDGPSCAHAVVTLVIRAPGGAPLWADALPASQVMTFSQVRRAGDMAVALREWLTQSHQFRTSFDLPVWKKGEAAPIAGEFPFHPDEAVDHDYYEQIQSERLPVFCYVQGMESMACIVLKDGTMMKIGLQSFPG